MTLVRGEGRPSKRLRREFERLRRAPTPERLRATSTNLASAPEFGELLGEGSALVVTGSSGGRTQRQIHRIGAEHVLGVAVREDRFDSAAACAEFVDLCCEMHAPVQRRAVFCRRMVTAPAPARIRLPDRHSRRCVGSRRRCIGCRRSCREGHWHSWRRRRPPGRLRCGGRTRPVHRYGHRPP